MSINLSIPGHGVPGQSFTIYPIPNDTSPSNNHAQFYGKLTGIKSAPICQDFADYNDKYSGCECPSPCGLLYGVPWTFTGATDAYMTGVGHTGIMEIWDNLNVTIAGVTLHSSTSVNGGVNRTINNIPFFGTFAQDNWWSTGFTTYSRSGQTGTLTLRVICNNGTGIKVDIGGGSSATAISLLLGGYGINAINKNFINTSNIYSNYDGGNHGINGTVTISASNYSGYCKSECD